MSFQRLSEGVEGKSRPQVNSRSTVEDRRPRNSLSLRSLCVRGTSSFRMPLELDRSGRRPTIGDSRLRGTREPVQQATDVRAPQS